LNLVAGANSFINDTISICHGSAYAFNGHMLTSSGIYYDTLSSSGGCNTLVTLYLTVLQGSTQNISQTICNHQSYNFYGQQLFASGTYSHHFTSHNGCDSIVILTLTVNAPNKNVVQTNDSTLTSQATSSTYQWVTCHGNNQNIYVLIHGATQQSYIADTTGWYAVIVTTNGCTDTSVCYLVNKISNVGMDNISSKKFSIYPNPTEDIINVKWASELGLKKLILQNIVGKVVEEISVVDNKHEEIIHLENLPSGIYFLNLQGNTNQIIKVIKE
jgi:Secretion system C-terminal sorting domain